MPLYVHQRALDVSLSECAAIPLKVLYGSEKQINAWYLRHNWAKLRDFISFLAQIGSETTFQIELWHWC